MKKDKFYIITIDKGGLFDMFDVKKFHDQLTTANGIKAWWHYLDSTYIIRVDFGVTAHNISNFIISFAPNKKFFTAELKLDNYNGFLPQEAWDWIKNNRI